MVLLKWEHFGYNVCNLYQMSDKKPADALKAFTEKANETIKKLQTISTKSDWLSFSCCIAL